MHVGDEDARTSVVHREGGEGGTDASGPVLGATAVAAAVLLAFLPSLANGWVPLDDRDNFLLNPHYRGLSVEHLRWMFSFNGTGHYVPVTWLTLGLDYVLWGMRPAGYHLTSLLFHLANGLLFFALALRLLGSDRDEAERSRPARVLAAAAAGLLFAVHPLRVESVAWVTERRDVVCGLFVLLSLHAYVSAARSPARRGPCLGLSLAAFAAALLSKGVAVALPAALVALDAALLGRLPLHPGRWRDRGFRPVWREKLPYVGLAAASGLVTLAAASDAFAPAGRMAFWPRLLTAAYGVSYYVERTLWPFDLPLVVNHVDLPRLGLPPFGLRAAAVAAAVAAAAALARRFPRTVAASLVYLAFLLPVSGLLQAGPQLVAHRYTYLSTLPFALLAGEGVRRLASGRSGDPARWGGVAAGAGVGAVALLLVFATRAQVANWKDDWTFAVASVRGAPRAWQPRIQVAALCLDRGRFREALEELRVALRSHAENVDLLAMASLVLSTSPDPAARDGAEALRLAERAVRLAPRDPRARAAVAAAHAELGEFEAAALRSREGESAARREGRERLEEWWSALRGLAEAGRPLRMDAAGWGAFSASLAPTGPTSG